MRFYAWFALLGLLLPTITARPVSASPQEAVAGGAILNVRTTQPIYADSVRPGARFTGIVDDPVVVNGRAIPRGARATLEVVGVERSSNLKGRDRINFRVRSVHAGNNTYAVSSNYVQVKGPSEGKKAAKKGIIGGGIGAAVGGLIGGGTGAAVGATAGAGTGVAIAGSGKEHLVVPAETRLQFHVSGATRIAR
jgi:hypothetical protein